MVNVEFFFDPSCPWTWITSRWLATVAPHRDVAITWRPWSLVIKNEGKELPAKLPAAWRERIEAERSFAVAALRVLEAAAGDARGRLYTELGRRFHGEGSESPAGGDPRVLIAEGGGDPRALIAEAVAAAGLPGELAQAGGDERWDEPIRDCMDEIRLVVGDDVGVPIVAIRDGDHLRAMAGPIMAEVASKERAVALWDAVATVITEPAVFELKRHRTASPQPPALAVDGGKA